MESTPLNDHGALLCESCGYQIDSLPPSAACPECGISLALSLPAARPGTAWQSGRSLSSLAATAWVAASRPRELFARLAIHPSGARAMLGVNLAIAAGLAAHPFVGVFYFDPARGMVGNWSPRALALAATSAGMLFTLAFLVLLGLTMIEFFGIRFIAARRGWRLLPVAALQIVANASMGWVLGGLLLNLGFVYSSFLPTFPPVKNPQTFWDELLMLRTVLPAFAPLVGMGLGLLYFEWLVYLGVRVCKFANRTPTIALERR